MRSLRWLSAPTYRTTLLTCAVFFASGLTIASIGPNLPALAARSRVDIVALGGLFTTFSAGVLLAQFGVAPTTRRLGQRATLAASMLLMCVGSLALAQGIGLPALFGAALLSGVGFGGVLATGNTLIAQLFPTSSAAALNGINLFFGIGSITGPALAAAANARLSAPQIALWIGAGALALLAPLVLAAAASSAAIPSGASGGASSSTGRIWLFGLLLFVYTGIEIGFGGWLTLYMVRSVAMDGASAALVVSGFWLALTGGRALAAVFGLRIRAQSLIKLCMGGMLLGAGLLAVGIGNTSLTLASVLVFGLSCGPIFPTALALVAAGAQGAAATSKVLVLGNGGGLLLPALLGLLLTHYGSLAVAALLILAAVVMIGLGSAALRPQPQATMPVDGECAPVC